ncbi:XdhC/CoxI family protein [Pseudoxanthomonas sp.]|uniref:XdhC family protein n=1 Tax=Pseudoxanthomonas sp. TaxID=1871049 RepID=UPI00258525EA|nr:XdhC/CoxI family protein [Pseudoxanthomonas sp.]MCR6686676.1 XdhC family protein [Pseudoxanthomonas sp.]
MTATPPVLLASAQPGASAAGRTLAVVVATEGSTYVRAGATALFGPGDAQLGWLSGGCLEPEIARRARDVARRGAPDAMEIDTRDDEDLFAGSAVGCRGRLRIVLLPLERMPGWTDVVRAWWDGRGTLTLAVSGDGQVQAQAGDTGRRWAMAPPPAGADAVALAGEVQVPPPARVAIFGAGPETPLLVQGLRTLGWHVTVVERRARWIPGDGVADARLTLPPDAALHGLQPAPDAVLVMHHHFEHDREALEVLAHTGIAFIGLLGPVRRREDLMRVLPVPAPALLAPRLRSPVGLKLGGHGPEAIALSIVAQLQAWRHGEAA